MPQPLACIYIYICICINIICIYIYMYMIFVVFPAPVVLLPIYHEGIMQNGLKRDSSGS